MKSKVGKDRLELTFKSSKTVNEAKKVLGKKVSAVNEKEHSLTIVINDTNKDVKAILESLSAKNISIDAMAVHKPTLDDVFLSLTGKQKQDKKAEEK